MSLINRLSGKSEAKKMLMKNGFVIKAVDSGVGFCQIEKILSIDKLNNIKAKEMCNRSGMSMRKVVYFELRE